MVQYFEFEKTELQDLIIIHPFISYDERGYLLKSYEKDIFLKNGITIDDQEDLISYSKGNVIRGLHFQVHYPQDKYIVVSKGKIYDVVVDLRRKSSTFGKWKGIELSDENRLGLYIPRGFAHGFKTMSDEVKIQYKCGGRYMPNDEGGIIWNDPDIGIEWNIESEAIHSIRDNNLMSFSEFCENLGGL